MHCCFHLAFLIGSQLKLLFQALVSLCFDLGKGRHFEFPNHCNGEAPCSANDETCKEDRSQIPKCFPFGLDFHGTKAPPISNRASMARPITPACCSRISRTAMIPVATNRMQAATN